MKKIVIIGLVWPEPKSTGAGIRMMQLINYFIDYNYEVIFASAAEKTDFSFQLNEIDVQEKQIKLNSSEFDEWIKLENPDFVLFDRFITEEQFGWRVSENCPETIKILDTEDLHFLRKARELCFKNQTEASNDYLKSLEITKREIASIYRCDLSLIISKYEFNLSINEFKIDKDLLLHLPFMFNQIDHHKDDLNFSERKDFICIGNFLHSPNADAIFYLKNEIWPLIREQLPKVNLQIFGAYSSQKINQLHNEKEGFIVNGRAEDAQKEISKYRVNFAPLRFGAGLKTKLVEGMMSGTPAVTTEIGAEGFEFNEWNGFIENNPDRIASQAIELYSNELLWKKKQSIGYHLLNQFNKNELHQKLTEKLLFLTTNKIQLRNNNFIGGMLCYHNNKSNKYLSKWIEEKNK